MGGRGAWSASFQAGGSYGVSVKRNQSLSEIAQGAHNAFSAMDRSNLRINLNRTQASLANAGRKLAGAQRTKRVLERDLSEARKAGSSKGVKTITYALKLNERNLQTQMINVQSLKTARDIARSYYSKAK